MFVAQDLQKDFDGAGFDQLAAYTIGQKIKIDHFPVKLVHTHG